MPCPSIRSIDHNVVLAKKRPAWGVQLVILVPLLVAALATPSSAQLSGEAIPGTPFGVGRITIRLAPDATSGLSGTDAWELAEKNDRVLYPTSGGGLSRLLGGERNQGSKTFFFPVHGQRASRTNRSGSGGTNDRASATTTTASPPTFVDPMVATNQSHGSGCRQSR